MTRLIIVFAVVAGTWDLTGMERFNRAVDQYVTLRATLEAVLAAPEGPDDYENRVNAAAALRRAIQAVRCSAVEGELFSPEASDAFRARIRYAFGNSEAAMIEYVEALMADTWEAIAPRVNEPFPWVSGNGMLPTVLELLPDLPPDMEYRFVGADLVLIDLRSELVVDILRDALPTPTLSYERRADAREPTVLKHVCRPVV